MSAPAMILVGAGHAAVRAALSLREAGYDGAVTMIAREGVDAPYERPPLSKWSVDSELARPIVPKDQLVSAGIKRIAANVSSIDRTTRCIALEDGTRLPYARLLLATGASTRLLDPDITNGAPVHYLRGLADATALRYSANGASTAVIIGGGFIGLELAASLRGIGIDVQVLEAEDRILLRAVTAPVARIVQDLHEARGVTFHLGARLKSIEPGRVTLTNGRTLQADLLVAGIGSIPNTLLAEDAGLAVQNGITVNRFLQTSDPDVFAAGDCCSFPLYGPSGPMTRLESWQAAGIQGALAAQNMTGSTQTACTLVPWFWSEQYGHVLQVSGLPGKNTSYVERTYDTGHHISFGLCDDGTLALACGIAPGTKVAKDIRLAAKLIEAGTVVGPDRLGDPEVALKSLLRR